MQTETQKIRHSLCHHIDNKEQSWDLDPSLIHTVKHCADNEAHYLWSCYVVLLSEYFSEFGVTYASIF